MDLLAREGILGLVRTIPPGFPSGSDIANLVILGYDPAKDYTGRGPLEAASMGVELEPGDVAFRCNLVHISLEEARPRMVDFTAGHIRTEQARSLIEALDRRLGREEIRFHPGVSYRHLMVWRGGPSGARTTPPHDITGRAIEDYLPKGPGSERLRDLIVQSQAILRELRGKGGGGDFVANSIWLWGQGKPPKMEPLTHRWGFRGAIITAVDLLKGLGRYAGLEVVEVPGATGYYDTDYRAKSRYALEALMEGADFVFVHVEAPDEAGHQGDVKEKIRAVERFDGDVVGPLLEGMRRWKEWALMVLPDHATPIEVMTHTEEPVPFAVLDSRGGRSGGKAFSEAEAARSGCRIDDGKELIQRFLGGRWEDVS
jgi:2,3-bisphosphoglycerate-independent phosphoglycerate mutase